MKHQDTETMSKLRGFTLIELMITVVIASVLLAIAIPSYRDYVLRSNRADGKTALLSLSAAQERFYLQNGTYATQLQLTLPPPAGLGFTSGTSERGYYILTIANGDATGFSIVASADPAERQSDDDDCQSFRVNERGQREAADSGGSFTQASTDTCWG